MIQVSCPACHRVIPLPEEARIPPWCPHCGTDLKGTVPQVVAAPLAPSALLGGGALRAAMLPDGALERWKPPTVNADRFPAGPGEITCSATPPPAPPALPADRPILSKEPLAEKHWSCPHCGCEFAPIPGNVNPRGEWASRLTGKRNASEPCPSCGNRHPALLPSCRLAAHLTLTGLTGLALLVVLALGFREGGAVFGAGLWVLAGFGVVLLLLHALGVWYEFDPPTKNDPPSWYRVLRRGRKIEPLASPVATARAWAALGLIGAGCLLVPVAEVTRHLLDWPYSPDSSRGLIGPGDKVRVTLSRGIRSADRRWKATARAAVDNARELGLDSLLVKVEPRSNPYGEVIRTKAYGDLPADLRAELTLPRDPRLAGQVVRVRVEMDVTYPTAVSALAPVGMVHFRKDHFVEKTSHLDERFTFRLATPKARSTYTFLALFGALGGMTLAFLGGLGLCLLARKQVETARPPGPAPSPGAENKTAAGQPDRVPTGAGSIG